MTWTWGRQNISDGIYILINLTIYYIINWNVRAKYFREENISNKICQLQMNDCPMSS